MLSYRFYPGDTLSVQTFTSNETKSSTQSWEGGKRYKRRQNLDMSLEEQSLESEEPGERRIPISKQHDNERIAKTNIDGEANSKCSHEKISILIFSLLMNFCFDVCLSIISI